MAPKKRKKKMTEEERKAFEEQKRLEMEEARKRKEEMITAVLKDRIAKEERASAFSHNKLVHQWRRMLREAKTKELKKEIEALSQTYERITDRLDATVKNLLQDMADSEEQYAMAFRSHIQNIDYLIALQQRRIQAVEDDFQAEQETIREEFDTERAMMNEMHYKEINDLADILFALEERFQELEAEARSEFQSNRDELKNKDLEEKHALRVNLEQKVEDLWLQFRQALQNYNETTEERKTAFEALKLKDEKSAQEIELQMRKLQRISDRIAALRARMQVNAREGEERNKLLRERKERMRRKFQEVKLQVNNVRAREREKLTKMTLESTAAIRDLRRKKDKAELILRLAHMCRKKETEEEKVLPFYASTLTPEQLANVEAAILEPPIEPLASLMHDYSALENFWKRYNKVFLERLALEKEKQMLQDYNTHLRFLLKEYLNGVSVNAEVLNQRNTLFVVNSRAHPRLRMTHQPVSMSFTEAAVVAKNLLP